MTSEPVGGLRAGRTLSDSDEQLLSKVKKRLMPMLILASALAYLDRVSIGVVADPMSADIGLTATTFGLASGLFFLGYFVAEIPSNVALQRFGGRRWIARIMLTWGVITVATTFVESPEALYTLRFLLGLAEAGLFPGIILYCTYWFPQQRLGSVYALFITSIPIAFASTSLIVSAILSMDGLVGLTGWQWAFLLTGLPPILLGIAFWRMMPDTPASAPKWLSSTERQRLTAMVESEAPVQSRDKSGWSAFTLPMVWFYCFAYFCIVIGFWSFTFWLPQIVGNRFELDAIAGGLLSAVPWAFGAIVMVVFGKVTERTVSTRWIQVGSLVTGGIGMLLAAAVSSAWLALVGLCLAAGGILSASAQFWAQPTARFAGAVGAVAFAMINSVGNLGGFVGPYMLGLLEGAFGSARAGLYVLAGFLFVAALLAIVGGGQRRGAATEPPVSVES